MNSSLDRPFSTGPPALFMSADVRHKAAAVPSSCVDPLIPKQRIPDPSHPGKSPMPTINNRASGCVSCGKTRGTGEHVNVEAECFLSSFKTDEIISEKPLDIYLSNTTHGSFFFNQLVKENQMCDSSIYNHRSPVGLLLFLTPSVPVIIFAFEGSLGVCCHTYWYF